MRPRSPPPSSTGRFPSPGSVRHRFVRENDERHMIDGRYKAHHSSSRSPNARFGSRNDATYRRSPESRRQSDNHQSWTRNAGSPNPPREPLAQRLNASATARNRSLGVTIDFEGLRDVPTGPRPKRDSISWPSQKVETRESIASPGIPKKRDFVTRSPCIFISLRFLPDEPRMTRHLYGMLGTELRPQNVKIDDYGWNLVYEDSPAGLEKLTRCFERYNKELLFSQYELRMQCYPNGKQPRPQQDADIHSSGGPDSSSTFDKSVTPRVAGFNGRQLTYPRPIESLESRVDAVPLKPEEADNVANTPSHAQPDDLINHSSDTTRTHAVPPVGTSTPLLSLRSDRDETGSLGSGATRSDGSRIKRDRCFRCRGEAVPGSSILVRCSTCPRQYHRRCHLDVAIPADLLRLINGLAHLVSKRPWLANKFPPRMFRSPFLNPRRRSSQQALPSKMLLTQPKSCGTMIMIRPWWMSMIRLTHNSNSCDLIRKARRTISNRKAILRQTLSQLSQMSMPQSQMRTTSLPKALQPQRSSLTQNLPRRNLVS